VTDVDLSSRRVAFMPSNQPYKRRLHEQWPPSAEDFLCGVRNEIKSWRRLRRLHHQLRRRMSRGGNATSNEEAAWESHGKRTNDVMRKIIENERRMRRCPIIGSPPPPENFLPADNLQVKICPARQPPGQDKSLPVNCRPGETFLEGDLIMGRLFMGPVIF